MGGSDERRRDKAIIFSAGKTQSGNFSPSFGRETSPREINQGRDSIGKINRISKTPDRSGGFVLVNTVRK